MQYSFLFDLVTSNKRLSDDKTNKRRPRPTNFIKIPYCLCTSYLTKSFSLDMIVRSLIVHDRCIHFACQRAPSPSLLFEKWRKKNGTNLKKMYSCKDKKRQCSFLLDLEIFKRQSGDDT